MWYTYINKKISLIFWPLSATWKFSFWVLASLVVKYIEISGARGKPKYSGPAVFATGVFSDVPGYYHTLSVVTIVMSLWQLQTGLFWRRTAIFFLHNGDISECFPLSNNEPHACDYLI